MKMDKSRYRLEALAIIAVSMLAFTGGSASAREVVNRAGPDASDAFEATAASGSGRPAAPISVAANELQGKICQASIQDQIEWDYEGNRRWASANLERICENAKYSLQPGVCFNRVMHGNISHGKGTRWHWRPALNLCAGTQDASATIKCFSDAIAAQITWPEAIEQCRANP